MTVREGLLVLADGTTFEGELIGAEPAGGVASGEVVFNTVLSGYQEVLSDPSYAGQIITFTYPHIGNYGVNADDDESRRPFARGVVVRDLARRRSNWRATDDLDAYLRRHGVPGIAGVDTRRLTRHIREAGAMPGAFGAGDEVAAQGGGGRPSRAPTASTWSPPSPAPSRTRSAPRPGGGDRRIVAYDFGIKRTILRHLSGLGEVTVVPASTPADEVLARGPDGVFLSNGPGDPAAVAGATEAIARPGRPGAGVRHLPRPPAAGHGARRHDPQAPVRPPRRQPPGAPPRRPAGSRSPARTTTTRSPRARSAARRRPSPTSTSTTA